jgi:hypothetical protein
VHGVTPILNLDPGDHTRDPGKEIDGTECSRHTFLSPRARTLRTARERLPPAVRRPQTIGRPPRSAYTPSSRSTASLSRQAYPARKPLALEREADRILARIGQLTDSVRHAEHEQNRGVDPERYARTAALDARERAPAHEGSLRHESHGQSSAPARSRQILSKLSQRARDSGGKSGKGSAGLHMHHKVCLKCIFSNIYDALPQQKGPFGDILDRASEEVRRTLERAYRENRLDAEDGVRVGRGFDRAARGITRLRLDERVMRRAEASFPVLIRTLDALHLATALVWSGDEPLEETEIWTLDRQMSLCAGALGFVTPLFGG